MVKVFGKKSTIWYRKLLATVGMVGILFPVLQVYAKGNMDIMQIQVSGDSIRLYVRSTQNISSVKAQIGMEEAVVQESMDEVNTHTVFLLDNSLSITEQNQQKVKSIIQEYIDKREETEKISIAVFGEDIEYLAEEETDVQKLTDALEKIEYRNQDSFLTDVLYDELFRWEDSDTYTRFIIATDGVDNKAIGYTKEELQERLKENNYPIYALGCIYKENQQELENLFALSRLTKGNHFILDEYEEYSEIVEALQEKIRGILVEVPESCRDGSMKNLRLMIETDNGEKELKAQVEMPFSLRKTEEAVREEVTEVIEPENMEQTDSGRTAEETAEETGEETAGEPEQKEGQFDGTVSGTEESEETQSVDWVSVAAAAVLVAATAALIIYQVMSKRKKIPEKPMKKPEEVSAGDVSERWKSQEEERQTEWITPEQDENGTVFIPGNASRYIIALRDKNDPEKVFRYPLIDEIIIGRKKEKGVNIVLNYESSVSGRHCSISSYGERIYIEDLHSSNKTYLDDRLVEGKVEVKSGSLIRLGRLEMILEIERIGE